MAATYERNKTFIDAPIYERNDDSMKDIDFQKEILPKHMIFEKYEHLGK